MPLYDPIFFPDEGAKVSLLVTVGTTGTVEAVDKASDGNELKDYRSKHSAEQQKLALANLQNLASEAIRDWLYQPYLVNGKPVKFQTTVSLAFDPFGRGVMFAPPPTLRVPVAASASSNTVATPATPKAELPQVSDPVVVSRNTPVYPPVAKVQNLSGTVFLLATVSATGEVEAVEVISGPPILQQAAINAAKGWRYDPHLVDGKPVEFQTKIGFSFGPAPAQ
jgi:TonB family protein